MQFTKFPTREHYVVSIFDVVLTVTEDFFFPFHSAVGPKITSRLFCYFCWALGYCCFSMVFVFFWINAYGVCFEHIVGHLEVFPVERGKVGYKCINNGLVQSWEAGLKSFMGNRNFQSRNLFTRMKKKTGWQMATCEFCGLSIGVCSPGRWGSPERFLLTSFSLLTSPLTLSHSESQW